MSTSTSDQHDDTFTLPTFEDRLWSELQQLHGEENGSSRRPARGNPRRRYAAVVAALAAAASIAAVALVVRQDDDTTGTADDDATHSETTPPTVPATETEATYPPVDGSLDAPDAVQITEWSKPNGINGTTWLDEGSGRSRQVIRDAAGTVLYEQEMWFGLTADNDMVDSTPIVIDHAGQQYYQAPPEPSEPPGITDRVDDGVRESVASGWLVVAGRETVDGREAVRLVAGRDGTAYPDPHVIMWVEPATYRPLKTWGRDTEIENGTESTSVHTYAPRTPENLALLEVVVPPGYSAVERPPLAPM